MRGALSVVLLSIPLYGVATPIALTDAEVARGLKQALIQGADRAVLQLGRENGFLANQAVRIPLPPTLTRADAVLRRVWMGTYSDQLITAALTGYFAVCEQKLGFEPGTLDGPWLRGALEDLGPGAIEVTADRPLALFADGDRVDPCPTCARSLQGLAAQGLRADVVAAGLPPLPDRTVTPAS